MRTYANRYSDILLPFAQPVPFPIGCISYISLCIPTQQRVYVTSIISSKNSFMLSATTEDGLYSCSFVYKGNLTVQSTQQNGMFGVLTMSHVPSQQFSYTGSWQLHRRCIQTTRDIKGYRTVQVNGKVYTAPNVLNLQFSGTVQVSDSVVSRQPGITFGVPAYSTSYVSSVNDINVQSLVLTSSDSRIVVAEPVVCGNTVTIYLNTTERFPTCES